MYLGPLPELEVEVSLLLRWEGLWHPQEKESSHFPQGSVAPLQTQLCIFFQISPLYKKPPPSSIKSAPSDSVLILHANALGGCLKDLGYRMKRQAQ